MTLKCTAQNGTVRRALAADGHRLYEIRHDAICLLAPRTMPEEVARKWAEARSVEWVCTMLQTRDTWVFECEGVVVGWISVTDDTIDGLYTAPEHARSGIGSRLLAFAEAELIRRGIAEVRLESSSNAEEFYANRGYTPESPRTAEGTLSMRKRLASANDQRPTTNDQ